MANLCFQPVMRGRGVQPALIVDDSRCSAAGIDLWCDGQGRMQIAPAETGAGKFQSPEGWSCLASLACQPSSVAGEMSWWLVSRSRRLEINGVRPLEISAVEPGDLLAAGPDRWLVATYWLPEAFAAPAAVADRECPVCGGALSLAPVVRCPPPCGRYFHLENANDPQGEGLLNCYLTGPCGVCQREPGLDPLLIPDAAEMNLA